MDDNIKKNKYPRKRKIHYKEKRKPIDLPSNTNLPFFAYGIFKPGQLAYSKIKDYVDNVVKTRINYRFAIRDGVPILVDCKSNRDTFGYIIYFKENYQKEAYDIISKTESKALYEWDTITIDDKYVNVLFGINQSMGSSYPEYDDSNFNGINDPFFNEAITLIKKNVENGYPKNVEGFFELQMNYMLLWSAIDRYTSLKYNCKMKGDNNRAFANEPAFIEGLEKYVETRGRLRKVYSAEDIKEYVLDTNKPDFVINYYYTLRCNVVHRGKVIIKDFDMLENALKELLQIFEDVLEDTFGKF